MLARVEQNVTKSAVHLPRRSQQHRVIATIEHRPAAPGYAIHDASQASADTLHSTGKRPPSRGLYDQVRVVVHERVVNHAKRAAFARARQRTTELAHHVCGTKRWKARPDPDRHVHGTPLRHRRSDAMQDSRPRPTRATRASSRAAAPTGHAMIVEGELSGSRHALLIRGAPGEAWGRGIALT